MSSQVAFFAELDAVSNIRPFSIYLIKYRNEFKPNQMARNDRIAYRNALAKSSNWHFICQNILSDIKI